MKGLSPVDLSKIYSMRDRRSWMYSSLGLIIALAFISGALIAVDSSQAAMVKSALDDVPVDFIAHGLTANALFDSDYMSERVEVLESVDGVEDVQGMVCLDNVHAMNVEEEHPPFYRGEPVLLFLPSDGGKLLDSYRINGETPTSGTVAMSREMAQDLGVFVGDSVVLRFSYYDSTSGLVLQTTLPRVISQIWTQDEFDNQAVYYDDGSSSHYNDINPDSVVMRDHYNPVVMNQIDLLSLIQTLPDGPLRDVYVDTSTTLYLIWIDRGSIIDYANLGATIADLDAMRITLEAEGWAWGFSVQRSDLAWVLPGEVADLGLIRYYFLGMSMPVAALGVYIAVGGGRIAADLQRNDALRLKSEGATRKQVRSALLTDAVVLGAVTGALGLIGGIVVSRLLLDVVVLKATYGGVGDVSETIYGITPTTIVLSLLLGIGVVVMVSLGNARRLAVLDSSQEPAPQNTRVRVKSGVVLDAVLISLSIFSIAWVISGNRWTGSHGMDWYFYSIEGFVRGLGLVLLPAVPFMLTFSISRLLIRRPVRAHSRLTRFLVRMPPETKTEPEIHHRDQKSWKARLTILVGLMVAFWVFTSVVMESIRAEAENEARFWIGADLKMTGYYDYSFEGTTFSKLSEIESIEGVENSVVFQHFVPTVWPWGFAALVALDPEDYLATVDPDESWLGEKGRDAVLHLSSGEHALISEEYAAYMGASTGDTFVLTFTSYNPYAEWNITLTVEDVVKNLPGIASSGGMFVGYAALSSVPEQDMNLLSNGCGVIVDMAHDAQSDLVVAAVAEKSREAGVVCQVATLDDEIASIDDNPNIGGLSFFLFVEASVAMMIAVVGVWILTHAITRGTIEARTREIRDAKSKGSATREMIAEVSALVILGVAVGFAVAILSAYVFSIAWVPYEYEIEPSEMIITWGTWGILALSFFSMVVTAAVSAFVVDRDAMKSRAE